MINDEFLSNRIIQFIIIKIMNIILLQNHNNIIIIILYCYNIYNKYFRFDVAKKFNFIPVKPSAARLE